MTTDTVPTGSAKTAARQAIEMKVAVSQDADPLAAAAALIEQLGTEAKLYSIFVTSDYPRGPLAAALYEAWGDRLIGCTSAGNIGPGGFSAAPVAAVALSGDDLTARTVVIEPLSDLPAALSRAVPELDHVRGPDRGRESFAMLLVDGLSMMEEHLTAELRPMLGDIPLIGGSAGDDLSFQETGVLHGGSFAADRATMTVVSTTAPFRVFRLQHYEPGEGVLVITSASPKERLVHEINGMPAAEAFAEALGVPVAEVGPDHFSAHPLLLRTAGENWVRSISRVLPDGSLQFFAAVDTGTVLRLGHSGDAEALLRERMEAISVDLGGTITGLLAFDCILRRMALTRSGLDSAVSTVMADHHTAGFSTYGEQYDDFHMNQTMVGVAFGGPAVTRG